MGDVGDLEDGRRLGVSCEGRRGACGGGPTSERLAGCGPAVELDFEDHSGLWRSWTDLGGRGGEMER